jgi:uncharacterized protein (DUF885 family)
MGCAGAADRPRSEQVMAGNIMKKVWKIAKWIGLLFLVVIVYAGYRIIWGHPFTINELSNRQSILFLMDNPELFTSVGIIDGTLFDHHSGKLAAVGNAKRDHDYVIVQKYIDEVRQFDRASLKGQDRITYDVLLDYYGDQVAMRRFDWLSSEGLYPISPMFGTEAQLLDFMQSTHIIKNDKTARNYVARLIAMGAKLDALTADMQHQATVGVVLPASLLEKTLGVIDATVKPAPAENELVTTFVKHMDAVKGLDAKRKRELHDAAVTAVTDQVYPAYQRMRVALVALRPLAATQSAGVSRLPDGAAYYDAMLRQMTTSNYTADQLHTLGLAEVARITTEMQTILDAQGMKQGSIAARVKQLQDDPQYHMANTAEGRAQFLARYRQLLAEVSARMPEYFRVIPKQMPLVERMPESVEVANAGAQYQMAAMDGSRPGVFEVNERNLGETPTWGMKTLAYHEGIPGHHFQISIAQGLKGLPFIRQLPIYTAYGEGWALYAERFAAEIGMYKDDPLGDLGRLQSEIFRAVRLVVDTGIHTKGWTREQAIQYMVDNTGMSDSEVTTEIERYMALPGQACAYKVGELKILELRDRAKAAFGDRFSIKDFHVVILENGALPLTVLEKLVDEWIARDAPKKGSV